MVGYFHFLTIVIDADHFPLIGAVGQHVIHVPVAAPQIDNPASFGQHLVEVAEVILQTQLYAHIPFEHRSFVDVIPNDVKRPVRRLFVLFPHLAVFPAHVLAELLGFLAVGGAKRCVIIRNSLEQLDMDGIITPVKLTLSQEIAIAMQQHRLDGEAQLFSQVKRPFVKTAHFPCSRSCALRKDDKRIARFHFLTELVSYYL